MPSSRYSSTSLSSKYESIFSLLYHWCFIASNCDRDLVPVTLVADEGLAPVISNDSKFNQKPVPLIESLIESL